MSERSTPKKLLRGISEMTDPSARCHILCNYSPMPVCKNGAGSSETLGSINQIKEAKAVLEFDLALTDTDQSSDPVISSQVRSNSLKSEKQEKLQGQKGTSHKATAAGTGRNF